MYPGNIHIIFNFRETNNFNNCYYSSIQVQDPFNEMLTRVTITRDFYLAQNAYIDLLSPGFYNEFLTPLKPESTKIKVTTQQVFRSQYPELKQKWVIFSKSQLHANTVMLQTKALKLPVARICYKG
jgi:hypothetical protein